MRFSVFVAAQSNIAVFLKAGAPRRAYFKAGQRSFMITVEQRCPVPPFFGLRSFGGNHLMELKVLLRWEGGGG